MAKTAFAPGASPLRILLETDAPYMIPANIYAALTSPDMKGKKPKRLPLCHTGMIPWTADFVAGVLNEGNSADGNALPDRALGEEAAKTDAEWDAARVMKVARDNARAVYGV